jgi:hypothetical protein
MIGDTWYFADFVGNFDGSDHSVYGEINFGYTPNGGGVTVAGSEQLQCQGELKRTKAGTSIFGSTLSESVYQGELRCRDGRSGRFELVSDPMNWGYKEKKQGMITGQIDGDSFQAKIVDLDRSKCSGNFCQFASIRTAK